MGHIAQPTKVKFWFSFYIFVFPFQYYISHSCLQDSELMVAAWHHNKYGRNFCIGQTTIRLKDFCFGEPFARWYKLEQSERESYNPCFMMMWTVNWKFSCIFITTSTKMSLEIIIDEISIERFYITIKHEEYYIFCFLFGILAFASCTC